MSNIHFMHPNYLLCLFVVLPLTVTLWLVGLRLRRASRQKYGDEKLVDRFTRRLSFVSELLPLVVWLAIMTLLSVAMAQPVQPDAPTNAKAGTLQVVAVLDVSRSMAAEDYRSVLPDRNGKIGGFVFGPHGSRLDMAKWIITRQIMPAIQGNQLGVVTYQGNGFPQADLTDDFTALRFVFDNWITVGAAPGGGSDIGDGLKTALSTFDRDRDPGRDRVLVLFSDGGFTGDRTELSNNLQRIRRQGIKVVVVGLGTKVAAPIPIYDDHGQLRGCVTKGGQVVTTAIDESVLMEIASATGGRYLPMDGMSDLKIKWASELAGTKQEPHQRHLYRYPLWAAFILLLIVSFFGLRREPTA